MRRFIKSLPEQSQEVIAGKARVAGDLVQVEGQVVTEIDKLARAVEPLEDFRRSRAQFAVDFSNLIHRSSPGDYFYDLLILLRPSTSTVVMAGQWVSLNLAEVAWLYRTERGSAGCQAQLRNKLNLHRFGDLLNNEVELSIRRTPTGLPRWGPGPRSVLY